MSRAAAGEAAAAAVAVSGGAGAAATSSTEAWGYSNSSSTSQLAGAANRSVSRGIPAASNGDSSSRLAGTASVPPVERQPAAQRGTQAQAASDLGVPPELLPQHVAIIMDGNSRWAAARGLPVAVGHRRGVQALRCTVRACQRWGVPCLTVYAFSAENWRRPAAEVDALLALIDATLAAETADMAARGVRLRFIGRLSTLPPSLQRQIRSAELATAGSTRLNLTIALSYSGRQDLTLAAQALAAEAAAGRLRPEDITADMVAAHLATRQLAPAWREPDLVIRTSGEQRLSNFMCWEAAYAELYFSKALWPDFGEAQLAEALRSYAGRERRFGGRRHGGSSGSGSGSSGGSSKARGDAWQ